MFYIVVLLLWFFLNFNDTHFVQLSMKLGENLRSRNSHIISLVHSYTPLAYVTHLCFVLGCFLFFYITTLLAFKTLQNTFVTYLILSKEGLFLQRRQISTNEAVEILKGEKSLVLQGETSHWGNVQALNERPQLTLRTFTIN